MFQYLPSRPDGDSASRCDEGQSHYFGGQPRTKVRKQPRHHDETGDVQYRQDRKPDQAHSQLMPVILSAVLVQGTVTPGQRVTLGGSRVMPVIEVQLIDGGCPRAQDQRPSFLTGRYCGVACRRGVLRRPSPIVCRGAGPGSRVCTGRRMRLGTGLIRSQVTCHGRFPSPWPQSCRSRGPSLTVDPRLRFGRCPAGGYPGGTRAGSSQITASDARVSYCDQTRQRGTSSRVGQRRVQFSSQLQLASGTVLCFHSQL